MNFKLKAIFMLLRQTQLDILAISFEDYISLAWETLHMRNLITFCPQ